MIDRDNWSRIAHAGMPFMGPYGEEHLERALRSLQLPDRPRVVDLGCGDGAVLDHLVRTRGRPAPASTPDPSLAGWRGSGSSRATRPRSVPPCRTIWPSRSGRWARPRCWPHWCRGAERWCGARATGSAQPDPPLLTALGADRDELASLEGILARGAAAGLVPGRPVTSSQADWDAYEDAWADNGERFAAGHAGEPGAGEFLEWIRAGRRRYREQGGRGTLGCALMPFTRG